MNPMNDLLRFKGTDRNEYRFIKTVKDDMAVWKEINENCYVGLKLDFSVVNEEILTEAGIWDKLSDKIQKAVIEEHRTKVVEVHDRMEHARKNRRKKYDFSQFPEFLECKCGRQVKGNYYQLQKKADAKQVPLDDLVKNYVCQKCSPSPRGRKRSNNG